MTTTHFSPYQIAIPHQRPAYRIADPEQFLDRDSDGADLASLITIETPEEEHAAANYAGHQQFRVQVLVGEAAIDRILEQSLERNLSLPRETYDAVAHLVALAPLDSIAADAIQATIRCGRDSAEALIELGDGPVDDVDAWISDRANDRDWSLPDEATRWFSSLDDDTLAGRASSLLVDLAQAAEADRARDLA